MTVAQKPKKNWFAGLDTVTDFLKEKKITIKQSVSVLRNIGKAPIATYMHMVGCQCIACSACFKTQT